MASKQSPVKKESTKKEARYNMRMHTEDYNLMVYWADKFKMDTSEFLITAMRFYISWRNKDFDLPAAEIQRLNQLIDGMQSLTQAVEHLEKSSVNGFDAMLGIIRGDNYLVEDEDGSL